MMRARAMFLTVVVLSAQLLAAQSLQTAPPESAGFATERLERVDRAIERTIADGEIAGAVALVARDAKIVYHKSFGYADLASQKPMRTDTIFRIASMTKAVTTVGVMVLYEQGHFRLGDPISKFLQAFADPSVLVEVGKDGDVVATAPAATEIKIIDLLTHSSGISYTFIPSALQPVYRQAGVIDGITAAATTLESQMDLLASLPLLFEPGTSFAYGLSTDVLGRLIEVVSGKPLDRFLREEIFEPLGMSDTHFYLPAADSQRLATLYAHVDGHGLMVSKGDESDIKMDNPNYPIEGARSYFSGGAGLSSTAYDYARFIQMLLNDGSLNGVRVLGRKSVELMRTGRIDWDGDAHPDFGLGFLVIDDLGRHGELGTEGAYSWGGAFNTAYWIDPREKLIGVFMSQARPVNSDVRSRFSTLVYQALE